MFPSVNPANNFFPKAFQVKEIQAGAFYFLAFLFFSAVKTAMGLVEVVIKSQTLIPCSVPAATHYNLGLMAKALICPPALKSLETVDKSLTSQMYNFLSVPPEAIYLPLGAIDKQLLAPS